MGDNLQVARQRLGRNMELYQEWAFKDVSQAELGRRYNINPSRVRQVLSKMRRIVRLLNERERKF